jgi:hypothetical protein
VDDVRIRPAREDQDEVGLIPADVAAHGGPAALIRMLVVKIGFIVVLLAVQLAISGKAS